MEGHTAVRTHCERALRNGTDETGVDPERGRKRPVAGAGPPERTPSSPRPPGPAPGLRLTSRLGVCVSPETVSVCKRTTVLGRRETDI